MPHPTPKSKKFKGIKAVIFDWSGVISDDRKLCYTASGVVVEKYGIKHSTLKQWLKNLKASAVEHFRHLGIQENDQKLTDEFESALGAVRQNGVHPFIYADAVATLKTLHKNQKKLFVVSMHPVAHLSRESKEYGVEKYFTEMHGNADDKSAVLKNIISSHNFSSTSVIFVGDMTYDVDAGKKASVVTAGITTGYHSQDILEKSEPDIIINSLSELLDYV